MAPKANAKKDQVPSISILRSIHALPIHVSVNMNVSACS
jgi:hypothetical protein